MPNQQTWEQEYGLLAQRLSDMGIDVAGVEARLKSQQVETPSWGYADGGTRFGVFRMAGAPRTVEDKFADAAQVNKYTGIAKAVAVHIPWDTVADWTKLAAYAKDLGVEVGAVNPNVFQDDDYRYGSVTSARADVRARAVAHMQDCVGVMTEVGARNLSLWFADGTNFPGQADMRRRKAWMQEGLAAVYGKLGPGQRMLVEYKPFEPAFYHTDIADWGMAATFCRALGPQAQVLVDLGHHLPGANIEHIAAFLLDEGLLGGFHFNNRKYADDDLTTGSINPYELFLIYSELVSGENAKIANDVAYMIDESHTLKNKAAEMIQSLLALQTSYAKALVVDRPALVRAQEQEDLIASEEIIKDAFATDVRPLLAKVRAEMGLPDPVNPLRGFRESGYIEQVAGERGVGGSGGLGA